MNLNDMLEVLEKMPTGRYTPLVIKSYLSNASFVLFKLFLMGHVTLEKFKFGNMNMQYGTVKGN